MTTPSRDAFMIALTNADAVWNETLEKILPSVHQVDQTATRIWFRFWPLRLCKVLETNTDDGQLRLEFELDGQFRLADQIDSSVSIFYGSRFWPEVRKAVLQSSESATDPAKTSLFGKIKTAAAQASAECHADESLLLGITAAGFMTLRQVGLEAFENAPSSQSPKSVEKRSPEKILKSRRKKRGNWFSDFLAGANPIHQVVWNEGDRESRFPAQNGQDISSAASQDGRNYRSLDPRRGEGAIPAQCRSGACGFCWVGILEGAENVSELTEFEQRRLWYFGYGERNEDDGTHPVIRLACQTKCYGDVVLAVPPWNGVLDGER